MHLNTMRGLILVSLPLKFLTIFVTICSANDNNISNESSNLQTWCNTTPNPTDCRFSLTHRNDTINDDNDFRKALLNVAKEEAFRDVHIVSKDVESEEQKKCQKGFGVAAIQLALALKINSTKTEKSRVALSKALMSLRNCETDSSFTLQKLIENAISADERNTTRSQPLQKLEEKKKKKKKHGGHHKRKHHRKHKYGCNPKDCKHRIVVSTDGWGNYRTINEAVDAAVQTRKTTSERIVIHVKEGEYYENVDINTEDITLEGDGIGKTRIMGNEYRTIAGSTYGNRTVGILSGAMGFVMSGITVKNNADGGITDHQAVALFCAADKSSFYESSFESYKDTLHAESGRQFYRDCEVYGAVDIITGDAAAIFQNCSIYMKAPINTEIDLAITSSSRDKDEPTGFVVQDSKLIITPELLRFLDGSWTLMVLLGKHSKDLGRTIFIKTVIPRQITARYPGTIDWDGVYVGVFGNGDRASVRNMSRQEADEFTVDRFIQGNTWIPDYIPRFGCA